MSPTVDQPWSLNESRVFCLVLVVLEAGPVRRRLEPHGADLAGRQLVAVLVEDVDRAEHRPADRAGVREPVGAC